MIQGRKARGAACIRLSRLRLGQTPAKRGQGGGNEGRVMPLGTRRRGIDISFLKMM